MGKIDTGHLPAVSLEEDEEHLLTFGADAVRLSQSANYCLGEDILAHVKMSAARGCLVLNDCIGGVWRTEVTLSVPEAAPPYQVSLRFGRDAVTAVVPGQEPVLFRSLSLVGLRPELRVPRHIQLRRVRFRLDDELPDSAPASVEASMPPQSPIDIESADPASLTGKAVEQVVTAQVSEALAGEPHRETRVELISADTAPVAVSSASPSLLGGDAGPAADRIIDPSHSTAAKMTVAPEQAVATCVAPPLTTGPTADGYIDFYSELDASDCWVLGGWTKRCWPTGTPPRLFLQVRTGEQESSGIVMWNERPDLAGSGTGFMLVIPGAEGAGLRDGLAGVRLEVEGEGYHLDVSKGLQRPPEAQATQWMRDILGRAAGGEVDAIRRIATRPVYGGMDTLGGLPVPFHLEVDEVIAVPGKGAFVLGWAVDPHDAAASIRLRGGRVPPASLRDRWIAVERPDVRDAFASRYELLDARCGFLAFGEVEAPEGQGLYIEVELKTGEIGFKPLPRSVRTGASAIRRVLGAVNLTRDEIQWAYDKVLGPPLVALNRARLAKPMAVSEITFGTPPEAPRVSIVVPLYGRLDFISYQLALFSETGLPLDELIYVLDEPAKKAALLDNAQSLHARFDVPLRLILPPENRGFGPASNLGMHYARGRHVLFLNSDVFPRDPEWLDCMVASLESDPGIGIVGGTLLFADGSIQHDGMAYEPLPQFAGWPFPMHPGKGARPRPTTTRLEDVPGVTGACMLLRRDLALELGGFDEEYVIGDFEDADLCHRIRARGLRSVVDRDAVMYHLERQSQGDQSKTWRIYLTLLNAWTHAGRWIDKV